MPSFAVAPIALVLAFGAQAFVPARFGVAPHNLSVTFPAVTLRGSYSSDIGSLTNARFDRLSNVSPLTIDQKAAHPQFRQFWETHCRGLENAIQALAGGQVNLAALVQGLIETQEAVSQAQQVAAAAQAESATQTTLQRVRDSYSDPDVLTASNAGGDCTVTIAAHNRNYLDPVSSVPLNGGSISGLGAATTYFIYYDDETLSGGAVTYLATQSEEAATASLTTPYRHKIGMIVTPTTTGGGSTGGSNLPPWKQEQLGLE